MADLEITAEASDFDKIRDQFEALTRAEQRALLEGTKLAKNFDKMTQAVDGTGKKLKEVDGWADRFGKGLSSNLLSVAGSLGLVTSVAGAVGLAVKTATDELDRLDRQAQRTQQAGAAIAPALGQMFGHPEFQRNPQARARLYDQALRLSRETGSDPEALLRAGVALRQPEIPESVQGLAVAEAARMNRLAGGTLDLPSVASGVARFAAMAGQMRPELDAAGRVQAGSGYMRELSSVMRELGGSAGDPESFAKSLPKMLVARNFGASPEQALALTVELAKATGSDADAAATAATRIMGKLDTKEVAVGGKPLKFASDNAFERLLELRERMQAGEFKDPGAAAAAVSSRPGDAGFLLSLEPAKIRARAAALAAAGQQGDQTQAGLQQALADPQFRSFDAARRAEAGRKAADLGSVLEAQDETAKDRIAKALAAAGLSQTNLPGPLAALATGTLLGSAERGDEIADRLYIQAGSRKLAKHVVYGKGIQWGDKGRNDALQELAALAERQGPEAMYQEAFQRGLYRVEPGEPMSRSTRAVLEAGGVSPDALKSLAEAIAQGNQAQAKKLEELIAAVKANQPQQRLPPPGGIVGRTE